MARARTRKARGKKAARREAPGRTRARSTKKKPRTKTGGKARKKTGKKARGKRPDPARVRAILAALAREYPDATCALRHDNPLELLVATILSAQCTDERVNQVTERLFAKYRTARDYAASPPGVLEEEIRPTGFFNSKAKNIRAAARILDERHGGVVPDTMEELLELPGVARKTANVVLGTGFGIPSGIVVDTHVSRIARLLELTREQDPAKIERDLLEAVPREDCIDFGHRLIWHGRRVCIARRPRCAECCLRRHCPSARV